MNAAQVHLALTHMPVILTIAGLMILLVSIFIKKTIVSNVGYFVLIAAGIFAIPVFLSGEGAEEIVEELTGVTGSMIEQHQNIAKFSFYAVLATAAISIFALLKLNSRLVRPVSYLVLVLGIVTTGLMAYTAHLGGQIRHSEISASTMAIDNKGHEDGDDD